MKFHAVIDVSVAWSEVAHVHRLGREVTITLVDSTRQLRFWCPCLTDAARAAVLAQHFARPSRGHATAARRHVSRVGLGTSALLPLGALLVCGLLLFPRPASSYSVLAHEALVDALWDDVVVGLLRQKFPAATA